MLQKLYTSQLQKLIDALYMENFAGFCDNLRFSCAKLSVQLNNTMSLVFSCKVQKGMNPYQLTNSSIHLQDAKQNTRHCISPRKVMSYLMQASWWPQTGQTRTEQWWQECFDFLERMPAQLKVANNKTTSSLKAGECFAMAADRPFHPFAHAKGTLSQLLDCPQLHWWAFPPDSLLSKKSQQPAKIILTPNEQTSLHGQLIRLAPGYIALPLLQTQSQMLSAENNDFGAVNLDFTTATDSPTASMRTLASARSEKIHIKLSTSASTLGATRSMPPRYLINGDEACCLLAQILEQNSTLASAITLCDEYHWWVAGRELPLIENPGIIGCQIRVLPPLDTPPSNSLMVMSALNYPHEPVWLRLLNQNDTTPWQFVKDLSYCFIKTFLSLWCYGVMPECHGQNILVHYRHGQLQKFVLRDHDTLRICPTRLKKIGLPLPDYQLDKATPNSLVLDSMEELLAYFTTLGLQINLYPIALAALQHSNKSEEAFWNWVKRCIKDYAATLQNTELRSILLNNIINTKNWPFKQILGPLLAQSHPSTGMPSAMGWIRNPVLPLSVDQHLATKSEHEAS